MNGVRIEPLIGAETDAVQGQISHDDVVIGALGAGLGGEPGVADEGLAGAASAIGLFGDGGSAGG